MRSRSPAASVPALFGGSSRTSPSVARRCVACGSGGQEHVSPGRPGRASVRTRRRVPTPLGDQRVAHLGERLELAQHALAAAMSARAPDPRRIA